jgi:hypothetical protein
MRWLPFWVRLDNLMRWLPFGVRLDNLMRWLPFGVRLDWLVACCCRRIVELAMKVGFDGYS